MAAGIVSSQSGIDVAGSIRVGIESSERPWHCHSHIALSSVAVVEGYTGLSSNKEQKEQHAGVCELLIEDCCGYKVYNNFYNLSPTLFDITQLHASF